MNGCRVFMHLAFAVGDKVVKHISELCPTQKRELPHFCKMQNLQPFTFPQPARLDQVGWLGPS